MNALIERAVAELGGVDIAVSCVGIRPHQPIAEITLQDWQKVMNTNLGSAFILTQAVLPHMRRRKYAACFTWRARTPFSRWQTRRMSSPRSTACMAWRRPWRWSVGRTG
ncbi:SDR family NAD(P)-dependent oxidoreductase [Mesorhizobium sp.]|uniref:SDR family NAD(P)-dependent oxidoreductase n=1 Tax=Mesorhizobium sp. TaxID=1871066 RepID=UPI000FE54846|nr:MAG: SDR family oxidoreductase [Mesorhizobium sp.]TIV31790.1 MAG: SDR family oxidoreductase [Mesorhizobium sp.]